MPRLIALALCLLCALAGRANAQDCIALAIQAGATQGLPDGILPAIAMVESGHTDRDGNHAPWPWTLNQGGKSMYFDTKAEALSYLQTAVSEGVTNIDVGCMQLNWKWHAKAFSSPDQMIDPVANTRYAARFLHELHTRLGSWEVATAAYHSTDPVRGQAYLQKVAAAQSDLPAAPASLGTNLLASAPIRLDGILAIAGAPIVQLAAARAAAASAAATPAPAHAQRHRTNPVPDLPLVTEATRSTLATAENLPATLRNDWDEIQSMRQLLLETP